MSLSVFYSWQSDRPGNLCRYFIHDAAEAAIQNLAVKCQLELSPRLDHDTKGEAGLPEIASTVLRKIEEASFFIADLTFVGETGNKKLIPNPNVLLELGYAARAIGWQCIICVMNEAFGAREEQIFNVRHRRLPIGYTLADSSDQESAMKQLTQSIGSAVKSLLWVESNAVNDAIAVLGIYCLTFLKQYGMINEIFPLPTSKVTFGAREGTLDTAGFNRAVARLLELRLITCRIHNGTGRFFYQWTYLAMLVLQRLGWRTAG